eukprot:TRINITY_DN9939_c0_g1_i3.p2 TRINITY_DN9939_c0_g1~~TRINITY_DN9939_c0_g1_i3.p2  ORF type:complete len:176 (-),score=10.85 TRINITY_DN9939_c0_g1_i3:297-824(-)
MLFDPESKRDSAYPRGFNGIDWDTSKTKYTRKDIPFYLKNELPSLNLSGLKSQIRERYKNYAPPADLYMSAIESHLKASPKRSRSHGCKKQRKKKTKREASAAKGDLQSMPECKHYLSIFADKTSKISSHFFEDNYESTRTYQQRSRLPPIVYPRQSLLFDIEHSYLLLPFHPLR